MKMLPLDTGGITRLKRMQPDLDASTKYLVAISLMTPVTVYILGGDTRTLLVGSRQPTGSGLPTGSHLDEP